MVCVGVDFVGGGVVGAGVVGGGVVGGGVVGAGVVGVGVVGVGVVGAGVVGAGLVGAGGVGITEFDDFRRIWRQIIWTQRRNTVVSGSEQWRASRGRRWTVALVWLLPECPKN